MIVRVTFSNQLIVLFGDSYKPWTMQFDEFCWSSKKFLDSIDKVEVSYSKWVRWGGLKWCEANDFQQQLNREGVQDDEPDNPKPKIYEKMNFIYLDNVDKRVRMIFDNCKNDIFEPCLIYRRTTSRNKKKA
ncbi:spore protein H [Paenibacillus dendritiformis]|uniref:spore protein H n=1 Tax=Paenibacillus dendritiformis TaxID=130049 RepID=UPI00387E0A65